MQVDEVITCIDCGGRAHLSLTHPRTATGTPATSSTYRCSDCLDRWDLVVPDDADEYE